MGFLRYHITWVGIKSILPYEIDRRCQKLAGIHVLYLKCMLRTCRIHIQVEKLGFAAKKSDPFSFSYFCLEGSPLWIIDEKNHRRKIFSKFSKTMSKNGLTRTFCISKGTKSRKISPFGTCTNDWHAMIDQGGSI